MRLAYQSHGVVGFYEQEGKNYRNPHFDALQAALHSCLSDMFHGQEQQLISPVDPLQVIPAGCNVLQLRAGSKHHSSEDEPRTLHLLDLACGSGEAAIAWHAWLRDMTAFDRLALTACDPYCMEAFRTRTGLPNVSGWSFEDVQGGCLEGRRFDVVVCSFAMHLLDESRLFATLRELSVVARWLFLLSPHKRPQVKEGCGWQLVHEQVHERVHVRVYESYNVGVYD